MEVKKEELCDVLHTALAQSALCLYADEKEVAMRHTLPIIAVAALLLATAVDVIAAGAKMGAARKLHTAPVTGLSVALPSGMKSFPVELPQ